MKESRIYCTVAAKAIRQLEKCSLRGPAAGQDKHDWNEARKLLIGILDRNGFELAAKGIRKKRS